MSIFEDYQLSEIFIGFSIVVAILGTIFICCDDFFGKEIAEVQATVSNLYYRPAHTETEVETHTDPKTGRTWTEVENHYYPQEYHVVFVYNNEYSYDEDFPDSYRGFNLGDKAPFTLREGRWTGIIRMHPEF